MDKDTFLKLVPYISKGAKPNTDDYIYSLRLPLGNYDYNYSHSIVTYMKACGCKIKRTNWNVFGGFYIYYTAPSTYICPAEFIKTYKKGVHYDSRTIAFFKFTAVNILIIIILLICLF